MVDGAGVWTNVDGDAVAMRRGDLLLTPSWHFHEHHNTTDKPMAWIDGLDIPLVSQLDAGFFEFGPDQLGSTATPERSRNERLWGHPGLRPVAAGDQPNSPLMAYRWDAGLSAQLDLEEEGHVATVEPGHAAVRFTNPTTGKDALRTIRIEMHRYRAGTETAGVRVVGSAVWQVFEGSGVVHVAAVTLATMRIACVGGGPGGLFLATLVKVGNPAAEVTVFERDRADDTFGFGVVFADATLAGIHDADPVLRRALAEHGVHWDRIEVRLKGERHRCGGNGMAAIARKTLLSLLQQRAREVAVDLRFQTEVDLDDLTGFDLVVAADGANSRFRDRLADVVGPAAQTAAAKFIWFGTSYMFDGLTFVHERGPHGVFAVHGYPISRDVSTFIVETDERSNEDGDGGRGRPCRCFAGASR